MFELKNVSRLGNELTYDIKYQTPLCTYDITIYHDESLNIWDGTIISDSEWYGMDPNMDHDMDHDFIMYIARNILKEGND